MQFLSSLSIKTANNLFKKCFSETRNKYNTKATETTFSKPFITKRGQYTITFRGPQL